MQKNFRRLLAYSAVAQLGYVVLAVSVCSHEGSAAAVFYVIAYIIASLVALGFLILTETEENSFDNLDNLKGLSQSQPFMSIALTITLLSLAGIPPTVGFISKFWIIKSLIDSGFIKCLQL